jgi:protein-disulfide isomerase
MYNSVPESNYSSQNTQNSQNQQNRPNKGSRLMPLAVLIAGLVIAAAIFFNRSGQNVPQAISVEQPRDTKIDAFIPIDNRDHVQGDPNTAELVIVDYSDLECPYCKSLHETLLRIYAEHKDSGKIAWVYRHFPLSIHSNSGTLAQASECVAELGGDEAFWPFIDKIFAASDPNVAPDLKQLPIYAKSLRIDEKAFNTCLSSGKYAAKVQADYNNSFKLAGEEVTPFTVFVSKGKPIPLVDSSGLGLGALPYSTMNALINQFVSK